MNLLRDIADLKKLNGPLHLAIGFFDGVHLGHRSVITPVLDAARDQGGDAVVVTFDPHPAEILSTRETPLLLTSIFHKIRIVCGQLGSQNVLVVKFDETFAAQTGEEFVQSLVAAAPAGGIATISVGKGWQFGNGRDGNLELLQNLGGKLGFRAIGADTVQFDGENVSSTRIREAVTSGDFTLARQLLGRPYSVLGTVVDGEKLGRKIGFPTANLQVECEQLPPTGVYAIRAIGAGDSWNGIGNLGYRPTVEGQQNEIRLEVHLFGLDYEIYGQDLEVEFVSFVRDEEKFDGIEALKMQIGKDIETVQRVFNKPNS